MKISSYASAGNVASSLTTSCVSNGTINRTSAPSSWSSCTPTHSRSVLILPSSEKPMSFKSRPEVLNRSMSINYLKSCPYPRRKQALLSIRPEYARAIFSGDKRFEFRRVVFKRPVDVVVVYATSPIRKVLGEFDVKQVVSDSVDQLWENTKKRAGIDRQKFFNYFSNVETGFAIEIGETRQYEEPLCLDCHFGVRPPQSFQYLDFPWPLCSMHGTA